MKAKTPDEEIAYYKRVLSAWHWMSELSEHPDEVIRLLNIDARKLGELAVDHPEYGTEFVMLMDDYKLLASDVQERMDKRRDALVRGVTKPAAYGQPTTL